MTLNPTQISDLIIEFIRLYSQDKINSCEEFLKDHPDIPQHIITELRNLEVLIQSQKQVPNTSAQIYPLPAEKTILDNNKLPIISGDNKEQVVSTNFQFKSNKRLTHSHWLRYVLISCLIFCLIAWCGWTIYYKDTKLSNQDTFSNPKNYFGPENTSSDNAATIYQITIPSESVPPSKSLLEKLYVRCPSFDDVNIGFDFTHQINSEIFFKNLKIIPNILNLRVQQVTEYTVKVYGNFLPEENYTITLADCVATETYKAIVGFEKELKIPQRNPALRFAQDGNVLNLYGKHQIEMTAVNCKNIEVSISQIYPNNLLHFLNQDSYEYLVPNYSKLLQTATVAGSSLKNQPENLVLDLRKLLGSEPLSGAYFVQISRKENENRYYYNTEDSHLILVSDIGITAKESGEELFCWVTSLSKAIPIAQANITVWSNKNQVLCTGVSDAQGIAKIAIPKSVDGSLFLVQATLDNDTNILELGKNSWNQTRFDTDGLTTNKTEYRTFIYSNRNIYLPGETAYFAALIRDSQRLIPASFPSTWVIQRNDGTEMLRQSTIHDDNGHMNVKWDIPGQSRTGGYTIWLETPGQKGQKEKLANYSFQIEEYVPDRFRMDVSIPSQEYLLGDKIQLTCMAKQLQGSPATGRKVTLQNTLIPGLFKSDKYSEYIFGDSDNTLHTKNLPTETKLCDEQGEVQFDVQLPNTFEQATLLNLQSKITLHDFAGRSTTKTYNTIIHPHKTYIGTQIANKADINIGKTIQFSIIACDSKGNPQKLPNVQVQISKSKWVWGRRQTNNHTNYDYSEISDVLKTETIEVDGQATYSYNIGQYGQYRLTIQSENLPATILRFSTWSGSESQSAGSQEYLELSSDQKIYSADTKAKIAIRSPFDGTALVCLERERIFASQIVQVVNGLAEVQFDLTEDYYPNIYCTASVVRSQMVNSPEQLYRAYGILPIALETPRQLTVQIQTPQTIRPETSLTAECIVTKNQKPLANAMVTFALVDEGICQLTNFATPNPFHFFYGKESLQVASCDIYRKLIAETPPGGKDYAGTVKPTPKANPLNNPKSVAMWFPNLRTDENGQVKINLNIPKYIGELRLMAIATQNDFFGSCQKQLIVDSPLIMRLNGPRFVAWQDKFQVTATILYNPPINLNIEATKTNIDPTNNSTITTNQAITTKQQAQNNSTTHHLNIQYTETNGLKFTETEQETYEIIPGQEKVLHFYLECEMPDQISKVLSTAQIAITANVDSNTFSETLDLPIRSHLPPKYFEKIGVLDLGTTQTISYPESNNSFNNKLNIYLSHQPLMQFIGSLDYLLEYPYGCVEQTTSRAFPLLYLENLLKLQQKFSEKNSSLSQQEDENDDFSNQELVIKNGGITASYYVQEAIERLKMMQVENSGFGMWPHSNSIHPWGTCYATHFLVEAKQAGYAVPDVVLNNALNWLRSTFNRCEDLKDYQKQEVRAYSAYVLALANKIQYSDLAWFVENYQECNTLTRQMIGITLFKLGYLNKAEKMLDIKTENDHQLNDENFNSPIRNQALYVSALLSVTPNHPDILKMIQSLEQQVQSNGRWGNTQENAYCLLTLGKYAKFIGSDISENAQVMLMQDEQILGTWKQNSTNPFTFTKNIPTELKLVGQGQGKVFYRYHTQIIPTTINSISQPQYNLYIKRVLLDVNGQAIENPADDLDVSDSQSADDLDESDSQSDDDLDVSDSQSDDDLVIQIDNPDSTHSQTNDENNSADQLNNPANTIISKSNIPAQKTLPKSCFTIKHGSLVWVEFQISGEDAFQHLALEQWLPAGMEVENIRLANTEQIPYHILKRNNLKAEYQDIRSDRINIFLHLPSKNKIYSIQYGLRAICPGTYTFPGPQIHSMYHEQICSYGEDAIISIVE